MPNYLFATWGGDIGSAAAKATYDDLHGTTHPWSYYIGPNGIRASADDLNGDIDGLVMHNAIAKTACSSAITPISFWSMPLSQAFYEYYSGSDGYRATRISCFEQMMAAPSKNGFQQYNDAVISFAGAYYASQSLIAKADWQLPESGLAASQYPEGDSDQCAIRFVHLCRLGVYG